MNFTLASETVQIGIERRLRNIEREFVELKKLMKVLTSQHIQALRKELIEEGFDKALVELVGSVPAWDEDYKEDIRRVISLR